jgi:hypothetical protein
LEELGIVCRESDVLGNRFWNFLNMNGITGKDGKFLNSNHEALYSAKLKEVVQASLSGESAEGKW